MGWVYGMGVVPSHKYPPLFSDPNDDDTASGPPDLREQVTLLNRELTQQAEAHTQRVAAVEAACAEKTPPPHPGQTTGSPHPDDDIGYV
ncbi:hypothetical protein PIB30_005649 [Stylosanthes scabra]|uniref:Uncharacterized protein n=1 Tax=Stylosanthes scabra TaxID=79078 RepID=A0ABU6T3T6_9FABA|nr:hypothetical protein [Stylosanthes scabra]